MDKQEAIEIVESRAFNIGDIDLACGLSYTKHIINQIDEPKKVTIPKFVAEWIEEAEKIHNNLSWVWFSSPVSDKLNDWLKNHTETFMRAWLDGYEIEKEKLYTVEIPDPNSVWKYTFLTNRGPGVSIDRTDGDLWKDDSKNQFTESEIKEDFEWAWQWAKEVEEK